MTLFYNIHHCLPLFTLYVVCALYLQFGRLVSATGAEDGTTARKPLLNPTASEPARRRQVSHPLPVLSVTDATGQPPTPRSFRHR